MLVDLDKAGMPEALAAINLTEVVAALKEKNKQYATLTEQRANAKADDPVESAKKSAYAWTRNTTRCPPTPSRKAW